MDGQPKDIIRSIRQALGMTQAEFAQALGWAPSTISRWESGRAWPNRLALKIILVFGEQRGVRYRPRTEPSAQLPAIRSAAPAVPDLVSAAEHPYDPSPAAEAPRWKAALNFHVAVARRSRLPGEPRGWLLPAGVGAASLCAIVMLGAPLLGDDPSPVLRPGRRSAAPAARAARQAEFDAVAPAEATVPVAPLAPAAREPEPPPVLARLEGVTLLGRTRQAVFRTPTQTLTVREGGRLGEQHAARIDAEGVDLRDASGAIRTVNVGGQIPLE